MRLKPYIVPTRIPFLGHFGEIDDHTTPIADIHEIDTQEHRSVVILGEGKDSMRMHERDHTRAREEHEQGVTIEGEGWGMEEGEAGAHHAGEPKQRDAA